MPEIRYARQRDQHIAFSVDGEGPPVLLVPNWLTDVESLPETPGLGSQIDSLASYARLVLFDQPGTGHSDPIFGEMPSLETFTDAIRIVLDAAEIERVALMTWDLATPAAVMFAATHPDRVSGLITYGGSARWMADTDYEGIPPGSVDVLVDGLIAMWGKTAYATFLSPSMSGNGEACAAVARWTRSALAPGAARRMFSMALRFDVRSLLALVGCPTLVMQASRAVSAAPLTQGEYLAQHIPSARLEVFDSADHLPYAADHKEWLNEMVQEFITGERPAPLIDDRVLATVLFTDIVGSTELAAKIGDASWRELLQRHDELVRRTVDRYRGRFISSAGDGVLSTFDGPARAIRCACELHVELKKIGIDVRAGAHTGEVELRGDDIGGIAVHIGARVSSMAGAGETFVSTTVKDLVVGSGIEFEDRGTHELKGVPGEWRVFSVVD